MLERRGIKVKKAALECALDELQAGQLPLTFPLATQAAHFRNCAGWKAMLRSPRIYDLQQEDSPNRSQNIMNCHIRKTRFRMPNSLWPNCSEPMVEIPNARMKDLTGTVEATL